MIHTGDQQLSVRKDKVFGCAVAGMRYRARTAQTLSHHRSLGRVRKDRAMVFVEFDLPPAQ